MSVEHWENYFRAGQLATCPTGPDGGYDLELAEAWRSFLAPLAQGARVVDTATGNGAVLAIAAAMSRQSGLQWELHGCDLARIDPVRDVAGGATLFEGVRFHPGVATESLPFETASVDAVCGQYALEYSDRAAALREVSRVLRPGARAQFVMHHSESELLANARASIAECEQVLGPLEVFPLLRRVLAQSGDGPAEREDAARQLQALVRGLKERVVAPDAPGGGLIIRATLDAVHKLLSLRAHWTAAAVLPEVARAEREVTASRSRLGDLLQRASDARQMQETVAAAMAVGLEQQQLLPQHHRETHLVGWRLVLQRT